MNTHIDKHRFSARWIAIGGLVLIASLFNLACKSEQSVVSNTDSASATQVAANPASSPAPEASPNTVPTTPVGPVGQTSPTTLLTPQPNPPQGEVKTTIGNLPVTISAAKPAITPAPDPFPARPTPTVMMKEGKIVQQWQAPAEATALASPVKSNPEAAKLGREYYGQKCLDCHGKDGKGNGWMSKNLLRPPTNLASQMVQANSDGELFWKITNGKSPMPAHRIRFTDEQRWYIVAYLRTFKP
jgi:mono/diheme cytochrome c family protein